MRHSAYPSTRALLFTWALLTGLTIGTMIAGKTTKIESLGILWLAVLLLITFAKARLILRNYLDLKSAGGGWNGIFTALILAILSVIFVLYMATILFT